MAYSFQTFTLAQVLTAAQMNQVEVNIRDHVHGTSGVATLPGSALELPVVVFEGSSFAGGDNNFDFTVPSWVQEITFIGSNIDGSAGSQTAIFRARTSGGGTITTGYVGSESADWATMTVATETNSAFVLVLRRINAANQTDKWLAHFMAFTSGAFVNEMSVIDLSEALTGINVNLNGGSFTLAYSIWYE